MTKFLLPLIALGSIAAPAIAAPVDQQPISFERDGVRYVATVKTVGDTTLIEGYEVQSGTAFKLRTRNRYVTGTYGPNSVSYTIPR